jgi:hypothetical protein
MFPKCRHSLLWRTQILPPADHLGVDLKTKLWYDNGVGSDFSGPFLFSRYHVGAALAAALCRSLGGREGRPYAPQKSRSFSPQPDHTCFTLLLGMKWPPTSRRGSFLFLGFNHWVTSLSVESTEFLDRSPFRGKFSSSASFVFCVYVKRKMLNPAYRCTLHVWCHLFYDNSLSRRKPFCKTENRTNNLRINGIKGRIQGFSHSDNWQQITTVIRW